MVALPFTVDQAGYFFLAFVRVVTILALMPVFGASAVPPQLKVAFALILTTLLFTAVMPGALPIEPAFSLPLFGLLVVKEVMVGVAVGFVASMLFAAVQFAGRLVDTEMGFGFVELMDPMSSERVTVMGQLQVIIFTIFFLTFNGHYFMLIAVQRSFELIPLLGGTLPGGKVAHHLTSLTGAVFVVALKFSAPIYVTLILSELALGAVARTVPQINIFFVGMPLKIAVGLGTAVLSLPLLAILFRQTMEQLVADIWRLLFLMA
ncbi:MAG: flagellar biosynthetic protein FliR [Chitinispirillaceae bacterium]|nr:flagellar biosynthetic protein FliR [Chitinispirillaceae bacterium]